ncbi:MAG: hypothetical protein MI740_02030 [Halanaerobiales bacterium]|nr:hypothetical protein [Halanaerobiales bacterium]
MAISQIMNHTHLIRLSTKNYPRFINLFLEKMTIIAVNIVDNYANIIFKTVFLEQIKKTLTDNLQPFILTEDILIKEIYLTEKVNKMEILAETIEQIENKKGVIKATLISQNRLIFIYEQETKK